MADRISARRKVYALLSLYLFAYFAAQALCLSLLSNWLKSALGLNGAQTGIVFTANFIAALVAQPLYGFLSDKVGLRRHVPLVLAVPIAACGPFIQYVYAPLLRSNLVLGTAAGPISA